MSDNSFEMLFSQTYDNEPLDNSECFPDKHSGLEVYDDISAFPEEVRDTAIFRMNWIHELYKAGVTKFSKQAIQKQYENVYTIVRGEQPSIRSIQRWHESYVRSDRNIRSLIPKSHLRGNSKSRFCDTTENYISQAVQRYLATERPSVSKCYDYLTSLIYNHNNENNATCQLPSYVAFATRIKKLKPIAVVEAREGKAAAQKQFRTVGKMLEQSRVLERVEVDHTPLDLFVIDDESGIPLGRPYFTVLMDCYSRSIVGFYLGFTPPSYLSVAAALKNAILPKEYIKHVYPEIRSSWLCHGIPENLIVDNGKEFWSKDFERACQSIGTNISYNPVKKPWLKPSVERYFGTVNNHFLSPFEGKSFSSIYKRKDYNPEKNALITFNTLNLVIHKWVIDVYQNAPDARRTRIPNQSWLHGSKMFAPRPYEKPESQLNLTLGKQDYRRLTRLGITLNHLQYSNDELMKLRASHHQNKKVQLKYFPENLGEIFVLNPHTKEYFKVHAVDYSYAWNVSEFQHNTHIRYAKKYISEKVDNAALARAKLDIEQLVRECITSRQHKITDRRRAARYQDTSSTNIQKEETRIANNNPSAPSCKSEKHKVDDFDWSLKNQDQPGWSINK
ncbi:Mu transposase C-terminal domain-containing protein [Planctobacterium marinum]|uniref:Transposase n=1 Tax=Planctobacterium marinum TaxID=1631968 RepID=A0AA48HNK3_9ALTE|nr:transposase [Planctobacterium marinum]